MDVGSFVFLQSSGSLIYLQDGAEAGGMNEINELQRLAAAG